MGTNTSKSKEVEGNAKLQEYIRLYNETMTNFLDCVSDMDIDYLKNNANNSWVIKYYINEMEFLLSSMIMYCLGNDLDWIIEKNNYIYLATQLFFIEYCKVSLKLDNNLKDFINLYMKKIFPLVMEILRENEGNIYAPLSAEDFSSIKFFRDDSSFPKFLKHAHKKISAAKIYINSKFEVDQLISFIKIFGNEKQVKDAIFSLNESLKYRYDYALYCRKMMEIEKSTANYMFDLGEIKKISQECPKLSSEEVNKILEKERNTLTEEQKRILESIIYKKSSKAEGLRSLIKGLINEHVESIQPVNKNHKKLEISQYASLMLLKPTPKKLYKQSLFNADVPHDGSCLFYAVVFNFLLTALNNFSQFLSKCKQLFGENIQVKTIKTIHKLLSFYDGSADFVYNHAPQLEDLVDVNFRQQVVQFIRTLKIDFIAFYDVIEPFDQRLAKIAQPKIWGDEWEIKAMSQMLNIKIKVYQQSDSGLQKVSVHGKGHTEEIHLVFSSDLNKPGAKNNHYWFLIDPKFILFGSKHISSEPKVLSI